MPRYSEVLHEQLERAGDARDYEMHTSCPTCGPTTLGRADFKEGSRRSTYSCATCKIELAYVDEYDDGQPPMKMSGFRVGPWVLRTRTDVTFQPVLGGGTVLMPATPALFD